MIRHSGGHSMTLFRALRIVLTLSLGLTLLGPARAEPPDPAPIPDPVVQKLVKEPASRPRDVLPKALARQLEDIHGLALELGAEDYRDAAAARDGGRISAADGKRMQVLGMRHALVAWREEVRQRLAEQRELLLAGGSRVVAHDALSAGVDERFQKLEAALAVVEGAPDRLARREAVRALKLLLGRLRPPDSTVVPAEGPVPTFEADTPRQPKPQPRSDQVPEYVARRIEAARSMVASADDLLIAAAPATPAEAVQCYASAAEQAAKQPQDLAATPDVALTEDIRALAKQLNYSPVRIYQYVYDNIAFEPYFGSLKGAQATLLSKAGGATDQASLLIALLRASNIPARYVLGQVNLIDPVADNGNGRAPRWLGVKSYRAAANRLAQGRNPSAAYFNSNNGISLTHVWVEACVPYGHYRGARIDNAGHRWIPLDAGFKDRSYQPGTPVSVAFDYAGYLDARTQTLPHEQYEDQIAAALRQQYPDRPDYTLADVPFRGATVSRAVDLLPASLPYQVESFTNWSGTGSPEAASLPASHRYQLTVLVNGTPVAASPLALPQVALNRLTLSFKGATPLDQSQLDAWRNDATLASALPCSASVKPVLKVDGVEQPQDGAATPAAVGLCTTSNRLDVQLNLPVLSGADCSSSTAGAGQCVNKVQFNNIGAANLHSLQAYAFQASDDLLASRAARLLATVAATPAPNSNPEEIAGEFLHVVGLKYLRHLGDSIARTGELAGETGDSGHHLGLVASRARVAYLFDLPFAVDVSHEDFLTDIPGGVTRSLTLDTGTLTWESVKLAGYAASAFEHYLWQENARLDAVSTVRGLQFARETGIEVLDVDAANWNAEKAKLSAGNPAGYDYSPADVALLESRFIQQGYRLKIPRQWLQYDNWKGTVFAAERNRIAIDGTGQTSFFISGGYAGGYTVGPPVPFTASALGTGFATGITVPVSANPLTLPPRSVGGGGLGNGADPKNTMAGPADSQVNLVTGNVFRNETDVLIPGRGGLSLAFSRSYNSRQPKDGPLGFGCNHNYHHFLRFHGVEAGQAKVAWVDGSGAERYFSTAHHLSGDIARGALLTDPAGVYLRFERLPDGGFRVTEHDGLTYTFESVTAPDTPPADGHEPRARLLEIRDRYGNFLTLSYGAGCGNALCSVKDALNRVLTFSYANGRISALSDWTGRQWQYGYDAKGNLVSVRDPLAVADPAHRSPVAYGYYSAADGVNLDHALKSYALPKGNGMKFEYYADGRAFRQYPFDAQSDYIAEATTFRYNDFRRETVTVNARGYASHHFFDEWGNPVRVVDEAGAEHRFGYDPNQHYNRVSATDPLGQVTRFSYDAEGNLLQTTLPSTLTRPGVNDTLTYDGIDPATFHQPQKVKDARGNVTIMKYDARGNLTDEIALKSGIDPALPYSPVANQIAEWTAYGYDGFGNRTSVKQVRDFAGQIADPSAQTGPSMAYGFDANGLYPASVTRTGDTNGDRVADAPVTASLVSDSLGRLTQGVDPEFESLGRVYDVLGRTARATDELGQWRDYTYDANDQPVLETLKLSAAGRPVLLDSQSVRFDTRGRLEASIDAGGNVTHLGYDVAGNVVATTDPDGYSATIEYDPADRPIRVVDKAGHAVVTELDGAGRPRAVTDPNGAVTRRSYWDASRAGAPRAITLPAVAPYSGGRSFEQDYDANGNVVRTTDTPAPGSAEAARSTLRRYDALDRLVREVGPAYTDQNRDSATQGATIRPVTVYVYDALGRLTARRAGQTDADGGTAIDPDTGVSPWDSLSTLATYSYDDFGRTLTETDPLGHMTRFTYDRHGNVVTEARPDGHTLTYTWGQGHQLLGAVAEDGRRVAYVRNPLGQISRAETWSASPSTLEVAYDYGYDAAHRLATVTDSRGGRTFSYDSSPGGLLNYVQDEAGHRTDYLYDAVGRLIGIFAPNYDYFELGYDPAGRPVATRYPNGVVRTEDWNPDGTLARIRHEKSGQVVAQSTYVNDGFGRRKGLTDTLSGLPSLSYAYGYDPLDRVVSVANGTAAERQAYAYDVFGNRVRKQIGSTNPATTAYRYDAAHQLTEARNGSLVGTLLESYQYDPAGQMTRKTVGATVTNFGYDSFGRLASVTGPTTASFGYDHQGRRIRKTENGLATHYRYDGNKLWS